MFDSIADAHKVISALRDSLERKREPTETDIDPAIAALAQVLDVAAAIDQQDRLPSADEISDIGEQGLGLVDNLVLILTARMLGTEKQDIEQVGLVIAQWVISHHGVLKNIQAVVDGLAYLANAVHNKVVLSELANFMGQLARACHVIVRHDLDNANPARPWRVLNINRAIVATRSHDLEMMHTVFADLIRALPMDAPGFFAEGMSEMVRKNYPEAVCDVMQEFYERTKLPAVH